MNMHDTEFERLTTDHMNFRLFSSAVHSLIHDPEEEVDLEYLHEIYIAFKESSHTDVATWANEWFEDYHPATHNHYLKIRCNG